MGMGPQGIGAANRSRPAQAAPARTAACFQARSAYNNDASRGWPSSIARQPSGAGSFRQGRDIVQQQRAGSEPGLIFLVRHFNLNCGKLAFGLCKRGHRAADLRDQFVKGGGIQFSVPSKSPSRGSATWKIGHQKE